MTERQPVTETTWRNRFIFLNLLRIGATAVVILALVIWQTDWPRQGGWPTLGLPLALAGLVVSFLGPNWLRKYWRSKDA